MQLTCAESGSAARQSYTTLPADVDALRALDRGQWGELGRELTT